MSENKFLLFHLLLRQSGEKVFNFFYARYYTNRVKKLILFPYGLWWKKKLCWFYSRFDISLTSNFTFLFFPFYSNKYQSHPWQEHEFNAKLNQVIKSFYSMIIGWLHALLFSLPDQLGRWSLVSPFRLLSHKILQISIGLFLVEDAKWTVS